MKNRGEPKLEVRSAEAGIAMLDTARFAPATETHERPCRPNH